MPALTTLPGGMDEEEEKEMRDGWPGTRYAPLAGSEREREGGAATGKEGEEPLAPASRA